MAEDDQDLTIVLLRRMFPEFDSIIHSAFSKDPVFREMAGEYHECIEQEKIYRETGNKSDLYTETINELKEELLAYLNSLKSDKYNINNKQEN